MKSDCLPFSQIPHTTRLFADFLRHTSTVQDFYPRTAFFSEWVADEAKRVNYDAQRRQRVADILERQNREWGASPQTLENVRRFRDGAFAVVTGQQVGLFGGPAFSLYKALTAVKAAAQAKTAGIDCVPIFWLATEDHDLAEVNHLDLPAEHFTLKRLSVPTRGVPDSPVGRIQFGPEIDLVVGEAARLLGDSEGVESLRRAYRPGETFGSSFARLLAQIFAEFGVILLDAADADFHRIAAAIYRAAIEQSAAIDEALLTRGKALEAAGYHQQVKVLASSTLLFSMETGSRIAIHRRSNGKSSENGFIAGDENISRDDLLRRIAAKPEDFSPNVLLRPVVQDYLLPTLAYCGGAAEVAYFAQCAVVYEMLVRRITPILPRFSATIIEDKPQSLMEKYSLTLPDLFHGPDILSVKLAGRTLPQELVGEFEKAHASLEKDIAAIRDSVMKLDSTLGESATRAGSKMRYQLSRLRSRAATAELRRSEILARHAALLSHALYPNKVLQEREFGGIYFIAKYGQQFLTRLYETIRCECVDHQVVWWGSA